MGFSMANQDESKLDRFFKGLIFIGLFGLVDLILLGVFGYSGSFVRNAMLGIFGYAVYGYALAGTVMGILITIGCKPKVSLGVALNYIAILFVIICLGHLVTYQDYSSLNYTEYLLNAYNSHDSLAGLVFCSFLYPLAKLKTFSIVLLSLILVGLIALVIVSQLNFEIGGIKLRERKPKKGEKKEVNVTGGETYSEIPETHDDIKLYNGDVNGNEFSNKDFKTRKRKENFDEIKPIDEVSTEPTNENIGDSLLSQEEQDNIISGIGMDIGNPDEIELARQKAMEFDNASTVIPPINLENKQEEKEHHIDESQVPRGYFNSDRKAQIQENNDSGNNDNLGVYIPKINPAFDSLSDQKPRNQYGAPLFNEKNKEEEEEPKTSMLGKNDPMEKFMNHFLEEEKKKEETGIYQEEMQEDDTMPDFSQGILKDDKKDDEIEEAHIVKPNNDILGFLNEENAKKDNEEIEKFAKPLTPLPEEKKKEEPRKIEPLFVPKTPIKPKQEEVKKEEVKEKPRHVFSKYNPPDVSVLDDLEIKPLDKSEMERKAEDLKRTLAAYKVDIQIENIIMGPTFSRIEFSKELSTPVSRITQREADIKMALCVSSMRLLAPIPGKNLCGVEIPNSVRNPVPFKDVFLSDEYQKAIHDPKKYLVFAFGQDIEGHNYSYDMVDAPHMLIAGATKSGKSVAINVMLASLLCRYSPEELRLILFDPKKVEFKPYEGIPHLLIPNILTEVPKAMNAMNWAINEMERRYTLLETNGVRDIQEYNKLPEVKADKSLHVPYIVIVIDEFGEVAADATYKKQFETAVQRLTQKARAAGIHLVLATQRPSVNIISGTIKANIPTRICLKCTSGVDSNTILDQVGGEELLGRGDMLFMSAEKGSELDRVQGALLDTPSLDNLINQIKAKNEVYFDEDAAAIINKEPEEPKTETMVEDKAEKGLDPVFLQALEVCIDSNTVSTSFLQRKISVGFPKAAKIVDWMLDKGYAKIEGNKKVMVLTKLEFMQLKESLENQNNQEE